MCGSKFCRQAPAIGLLMALIMGPGSREAEASLGIIVTQTTLMPTGDPTTIYDFKLSLAANNSILLNDNITILNLPAYDGTSSYVFTSGGINYTPFFSIVASAGTAPGSSNIELVLTAGAPASLTNPDLVNDLPIGDLFVETSVNFPPSAGSPLFNPLNYTTRTHLSNSGILNFGSGVTPAPSIVPEPSSLALFGVGAASCLLMTRGRRRIARPA